MPDDKPKPKPKPTTDGARRSWQADALLRADFPPPRWRVEGMLPESGLAFLGGKPKVGKSMLALQLCRAVSTGLDFLGQPTNRAPVRYYALEDNASRVQQRLLDLGATPDELADLSIELDLGLVHKDGRVQLCEDLANFGLVVVDTFSRVVAADQNEGWQMTPILAPLQREALKRRSTLQFLDHHRKDSALDSLGPVTDLLGSTSKAAIADTVWGLYGRDGSYHLQTDGRDIGSDQMPLVRDGAGWTTRIDGRDAAHSQAAEDLRTALQSLGGSATYRDLEQKLNKTRPAISNTAKQLADEGVVTIDKGNSTHVVRLLS